MERYSAMTFFLFKQMRMFGIVLDVCTLNNLTNCYCNFNRLDFEFSMLGTILKHGMSLVVGLLPF